MTQIASVDKSGWIIIIAVVFVAAAIVFAASGGQRSAEEQPLFPPAAEAPEHPSVDVTYVANEGVLISSGDHRVLIDGLHREYKPAYAFLPDREREQIETAQPPFDDVDLILVSHRHLDHFHPDAVGRHLQHNTSTVLVTSRQIVDALREEFRGFGGIEGRVTPVTPPMHEKTTLNIAGIDIDILRLAHTGGRHRDVENLGHVITLGGKKLLHVGDAEASVQNFEPFDLDEQGIDVAFLPSWYLLDEQSRAVVRDHINPRQIVAVHISPGGAEKTARDIQQRFPNAVALTNLLETRSF